MLLAASNLEALPSQYSAHVAGGLASTLPALGAGGSDNTLLAGISHQHTMLEAVLALQQHGLFCSVSSSC